MLVKKRIEIAYKPRACRICSGIIGHGDKFYMTRHDWEPKSRTRVTCEKCVEELS